MKHVIMQGGRNGVLNEGIEKLEGKKKGVGIIMVSNFNREEWSRMARDAESRGLEDVAKRFGAAGELAVGDELPVSVYDELQREYRVWLLAGFPGKPVKAATGVSVPKATATHTPGPWTASHNGNDDVRIFAHSVSDSPRCVAKVNTPLNRGLESCANARLIAAAPTTLAERDRLKEVNGALVRALEAALAELETLRRIDKRAVAGPCDVCEQARAAIAKATQGQGTL